MLGKSYSGKLLVATPLTSGDVFDRAVVLMLHHDDEGAHGVVINKPLPASIDSVLPGWDALASAPVTMYQGGPVDLQSAMALISVPSRHGALPQGVMLLYGELGLIDLDSDPDDAQGELSGLRIFAGYAGWSAGQLEAEVLSGSWVVVEPQTEDVFSDDPRSLWRRVLRRQRSRLACLSTYPQDPEHN